MYNVCKLTHSGTFDIHRLLDCVIKWQFWKLAPTFKENPWIMSWKLKMVTTWLVAGPGWHWCLWYIWIIRSRTVIWPKQTLWYITVFPPDRGREILLKVEISNHKKIWPSDDYPLSRFSCIIMWEVILLGNYHYVIIFSVRYTYIVTSIVVCKQLIS